MNHLRELIESFDKGIAVDPSIGESERFMKLAEESAEKAVCFWMDDISLVSELKPPLELVKQPFPVCWFEGTSTDNGQKFTIGMLVTELPEINDAASIIHVFLRHQNHWGLIMISGFSRSGGAFMQREDKQLLQFGKYAIRSLKAFISAINCTNIIQREHKQPAALQKARQKRGKKPLFSYWTLELSGRGEGGQILGGTHASPRVHLRRGHPRQYAPGKWTWVQACAVGNIKAGVVHKDYAFAQRPNV